MTKFIPKTKQRYDDLGNQLEVFDNRKHEQDKLDCATDLKAYFMKKMAAGDMKTIEQLVRVNCLVSLDDSDNRIVIQGTMFCEPFEYKNAARDRD